MIINDQLASDEDFEEGSKEATQRWKVCFLRTSVVEHWLACDLVMGSHGCHGVSVCVFT